MIAWVSKSIFAFLSDKHAMQIVFFPSLPTTCVNQKQMSESVHTFYCMIGVVPVYVSACSWLAPYLGKV